MATAAPPTTPKLRTIHLRDALRLMGAKTPDGTPVPFSCAVYTYNRKTQRGGQLINIPEAVLHTEASQPNPRSIRAREEARDAKAADKQARHKPGAHFRLATRNLQLPTGDLHKVIVWLMVEFNGMRVIL